MKLAPNGREREKDRTSGRGRRETFCAAACEGRQSVGGGELERTDPERHHAHVRRARIDSFHLRVWSSSSSSEPRGEREEGRRAVFLGADMHIMRAAHLNIGADDDDRGIHQNRLAQRRFAVVSSSSFVD